MERDRSSLEKLRGLVTDLANPPIPVSLTEVVVGASLATSQDPRVAVLGAIVFMHGLLGPASEVFLRTPRGASEAFGELLEMKLDEKRPRFVNAVVKNFWTGREVKWHGSINEVFDKEGKPLVKPGDYVELIKGEGLVQSITKEQVEGAVDSVGSK